MTPRGGVGLLAELLQGGEERGVRRQYLGPRDVAAVLPAELVAAPLSCAREPAVAGEIDEPCFPAVEIAAAERRFETDLTTEAADRRGVGEQVVAFG